MRISILVIQDRPALDRFLGYAERDVNGFVGIRAGRLDREFERVEGIAGIPASDAHKVLGRIRLEHDPAFAIAPFWIRQRPLEDGEHIGIFQWAQLKDA